jgi:agmatine deiminase
MKKIFNINRPTPQTLAKEFKDKTRCEAPPKSKIYTTDGLSPVRAIAEFEPMGGVLIAYPGTEKQPNDHIQLPPYGPRAFGIPNELIVRMQQADTSEPVHIFVMCADLDQRPKVISELSQTAIKLDLSFNPKLIHFVPWDTDSFWTRDYGPWWIENYETGYYGIAKHLYTSLGGGSVGLVEGAENVNPREGSGIFRPNDDYGADKLADFLNAPIRKWNNAKWTDGKEKGKAKYTTLDHIKENNWFNTGLLNVGGNYMVNGKGVVASSYLVATQNELPVDHEKDLTKPTNNVIEERMNYILAQMNKFMGVTKYHVLTDPTGTYIGHIDCWGKFLAHDKVLIARSEDPDINKAFDDIAKSFKDDGFKVYRVMCQNRYVPVADNPATTAAYTNSLILNNRVYVPLSGKGYENYDEAAIRAYEEALPGYEVYGIIGKPDYPWLGTDAMHCRTRAIPREVVNNWLKSQGMNISDVKTKTNVVLNNVR